MTWNVFVTTVIKGESLIEPYNVLEHKDFVREIKSIVEREKDNLTYTYFVDKLDNLVKFYFSDDTLLLTVDYPFAIRKFENNKYNLSLSPAKELSIEDQLKLNWSQFTVYCWKEFVMESI